MRDPGQGAEHSGTYYNDTYVDKGTVINTIHQSTGVGVLVEGSASGVLLKNNLIDMAGGVALSVDPNSERNFASDYNLFHPSGTAALALWKGKTFSSRTDWLHETGFDVNSVTAAAGVNNLFFSAAPDVLPFVGSIRQSPKVDSEYNKDLQRDEYVTTMRYGMKLFRPENLVVILTDTDQVYV